MSDRGSIVITSIQPPTRAVEAMLAKARGFELRFLVIGDRKSPSVAWPEGIEFVSVAEQLTLNCKLGALLPENHYARKNIGYLLAMSRGAPVIFDTDDDNAPLDSWTIRSPAPMVRPCLQSGWINVYQWFCEAHIWPRGLPLAYARHHAKLAELGDLTEIRGPIQQGLANGSPDVDAVWRLLLDKEITFRNSDSVYLGTGAWCPFNSQSTWWFPEAYPLMYLPSFVSFRMTDIWRSFVAQRCLWAMGHGLVFHGPEMFQDRNPHDLQRDFEQEVPGYLSNDAIRAVLERTALLPGQKEVGRNLRRCYAALIQGGFISEKELNLLDAWLEDVANQE